MEHGAGGLGDLGPLTQYPFPSFDLHLPDFISRITGLLKDFFVVFAFAVVSYALDRRDRSNKRIKHL